MISQSRRPTRKQIPRSAATEGQSTPRLEGGLLAVTPKGILGWARDSNNPAALPEIYVNCNGLTIAHGTATLFDQEIVQSGSGSSTPGFLIRPQGLPPIFSPPLVLTLTTPDGDVIGTPLHLDDIRAIEMLAELGGTRFYDGYVDPVVDGILGGWVWSPVLPARAIVVELYVDGEFLDDVEATAYRADLATAGKREGNCAFRFELPVSLLDQHPHRINVKVAGSETRLEGSEIIFGPLPAVALLNEVIQLRAQVDALRTLVEQVVSPTGAIQGSIIRTLAERTAALTEIQRDTIDREMDAMRALVLNAVKNSGTVLPFNDANARPREAPSTFDRDADPAKRRRGRAVR